MDFGGFNIGSIFSGIGSWLSGNAMAEGYKEAAKFDREAARIALLSGKIKGNIIQRGIYQTSGAGKAAVGAGNIQLTGSAKDAIASNTQQGYLTKAVNVLNYNLEYKSWMAQAAMNDAMAEASQDQGIFGLIGGLLGMFSDDRLKENIEFIGRRGDGVGIYQFNYEGQEGRWEGVMASEIAVLHPDLVHKWEGYNMVDYEALGLELKRVL